MKHSEIFENFIKIAEENGLVESDKAIDKLDKTRRHDYLSADDIERLYNIKCDSPEDMKYKRNIIEDAHPNSVVVSPSYDKINGLVENNNERQNIILNIVNKPVNGQLTGHKYAHNELVLNLIRLANDLNNKNNNELLTLADVCLNQVGAKSLKKQAMGPLVIPAVVATMIAALWIQQQMKFTNEGFERNYKKLIEELDDLINAGNKPLIVGYEYRPEFIAEMQEFKTKLEELDFVVTKNMDIINDFEKPRDTPALIAAANSPEGETINNAYNSLRDSLKKIMPFITKVFNNFKSEEYKNKQIIDKGMLSNLVDRTQFLHGGKGMIADDFDDVNRALQPFKESLKDIFRTLKDGHSKRENVLKELEQAKSNLNSEFGIDSDTTVPATPISSSQPSTSATAETDAKEKSLLDRIKALSKSFST